MIEMKEQVYNEIYDNEQKEVNCAVTPSNKKCSIERNVTLRKYQDLFKCPNCKSALTYFNDEGISGFYCEICAQVFPIKEDILIILADEIRNYNLEYPILSTMLNTIMNNKIKSYLQKTITLVEEKKNSRSWEWDDEEFWGNQYKKQVNQQEEKRNNRYWQRQPIVNSLLKSDSLEGKIILSIGCGDGNNFRNLIYPHCDENSLYIAMDISFDGLALNKKLNPHMNSIYVLCSEDYELPIDDKSVDVICYFGILHHTRLKSMNIEKDRRVIKPRGYVLLHEAIGRPETFIARYFDEDKSAHEEYVNRENLLSQFREKAGFKMVYKCEDSTPFHTFFMFFFKETMLKHKKFFDFITLFDIIIAKTLGSLLPTFRAGCIGLTARTCNEKTNLSTMNFRWIPFADQIGFFIRKVIPNNLVLKIPQGKLKGHKWVVTSGVLEYYLGCFEPTKMKTMETYVQKGKVFYDLGAHVGYFSLLAAVLVKDRGHVISFEPNPKNIRYLKQHVSMNNYSNIEVIEAAISDVKGVASFISKKESSTGTLSPEGDIQVVTRTIDDLVDEGEIPPPDYMKIDVEGSETRVLKGALKTIEKYKPYIFLSTHGEHLKNECITLLHSLEYNVKPESSTCIKEASELFAFS